MTYSKGVWDRKLMFHCSPELLFQTFLDLINTWRSKLDTCAETHGLHVECLLNFNQRWNGLTNLS
jgi:hypothetical protein